METYAQTIAELFAQLEGRAYQSADLRLVYRAYELAAPLCTCFYRSSGRTLLEHALTTASVVADQGARPPLVAAAVLHAVYIHGDFGTRLRRVDDAKRERVRTAVGSTTEEIVYRYSFFPWNAEAILRLRGRLGSLDPLERDAVLIRLGDQTDIYATRDALYCANVAKRRRFARSFGPVITEIAKEMGFPDLAKRLERAYLDVAEAAVPAGLAGTGWKDHVIVPPSYRTLPSIALYQGARTRLWRLVGR